MVHKAMLETLADASIVSVRSARDLLFARLDSKLTESAMAHERGGPTVGARTFAWID